MEPIIYRERETGELKEEKVYGGPFLKFIYGKRFLNKLLPIKHLLSRSSWFSKIYGKIQHSPKSKKKILPFIKEFEVDPTEFADPIDHFSSFNDFFIRKLKPESRPITPGSNTAIIPADGRYLFYSHIGKADGFVVKGKKFTLESLLNNSQLAERYQDGTMVMARLCPSDYHRFHFPCDCIPDPTKMIPGSLYSVNPWAIRQNLEIFTQNKRSYCLLKTKAFGEVLFMEVGATSVGTIHQTYTSGQFYQKGEEKGYFSFGGSSLILLFEKGMISLDQDLLDLSQGHIEVRCLVGQSLGKATS